MAFLFNLNHDFLHMRNDKNSCNNFWNTKNFPATYA